MTILNFILENAPAYIVQASVKEFNIKGIPNKMKVSIIGEFPEFNSRPLQFGVAVSDALDEFKTDQITLIELSHKILSIQRRLSFCSKWHPDYSNLCIEHDALVTMSNKLNEPITRFLKLYKKAQKAKGVRLSVVKKKQRHFPQPA